MPFVHNIDPVLLNIGPLEIRYYGLVYVIGFLLVFLYFKHLIRTKKISLTEDELYDYILYLMIGVLAGSRLIHIIFWEPMYYLSQPWKIIYFWEGGMAYHGGLIGVIAATYLFSRKKNIKKKISFSRLGDYVCIPATLMLAIGRIANFINGELPGRVTSLNWCWYFPGYDGCRHPQQLYAAAKRFFVFLLLLYINKKNHKDGFLSLNMVTLFGLGRFFIDFYRDDPTFLGLTAGQHLSILTVSVGGYILIRYYRDDIKRLFGVKR